ncbi:MAG: DoxX family protein [Bacteroidota bacterium]|nr:DoxX family protein [Bacteroidota bacterium]
MSIATRFHRWNHNHPSYLQLFARIILGGILLVKGLFFISHAEQLRELILTSRFAAGVGFLAAYVIFAHLFGGVFIIVGLLTRLAVILQIPVLLGAIFFILPAQGMNDFGFELIISLVVLGLMIYVLKKGSGEISMDDYLKEHLL